MSPPSRAAWIETNIDLEYSGGDGVAALAGGVD